MKRHSWEILLGLSLLVLSVVFYLIHYVIFRDAHHIFIYLVGDIAFVFIEVLLVTLIIHQLLSIREKRARMEKLNMVIGSFFSEVGTRLLTLFSDLDPNLEKIRSELIVTRNWSEENFCAVGKRLKEYEYSVDIDKIHINRLREYLIEKRDFLLRLLENPNLLEHEAFTDVLQAVFHLTEELAAREDTSQLPPSDFTHIAADIKRAYVLLIRQWVDYMKYLKNNYPYLFSLAARQNPFDQSASVVVL
ncbi:MAG: hypothetical protein PVG86_00600 [Desulfobacterales bacterium]